MAGLPRRRQCRWQLSLSAALVLMLLPVERISSFSLTLPTSKLQRTPPSSSSSLGASFEETAPAVEDGGEAAVSTAATTGTAITSTTATATTLVASGGAAFSFDDLGLDPRVARAVRSQPALYEKEPMPIQRLAIPQLTAANSNNNNNNSNIYIAEAPTGAGKTMAYVLPLLHHLLLLNNGDSSTTSKTKTSSSSSKARISALILCPTRELVTQISSVVRRLASNVASNRKGNSNKKTTTPTWTIVSLHGGVPREPQLAQLAAAVEGGETVDVVVATPGRLVDVLTYYDEGKDNDSNNDDDDDDDDNDGDNENKNAATDDAFEQRLLAAMDATGDNSLSLEQIQQLQLDRHDDQGRASLSNLLNGVKFLILDEADRLLGRGFESELQGVLDLLPRQQQQQPLQTWLFSATFPKAMEPRMDAILKQIHRHGTNSDTTTATELPVVRIACSNSDRLGVDDAVASASLVKKLERVSSAQTTNRIEQVGPASTIDLQVIRVRKRDRTQALRHLLEQHPEWDRVLVFVGTRYASEHVSRKLRRAGIAAAELHGRLDQAARERRLRSLSSSSSNRSQKNGIRVLLATDVAARGLDIAGLPAVVNYELPRSTADFVHRCGRTGRAGRPGVAVTLCPPEAEAHFSLIEERHLPEPLPRQTLPGFEVDPDEWRVAVQASGWTANGSPSDKGLAHDRMFGGIKGRRKSKKDKLREKAAWEAASQQEQASKK